MAAHSTKDMEIYLSKGNPTLTTVAYTAISKADPAVVTGTTTGLNDGDLVAVTGTGMNSIDGKYFVVSGKTATEFTLLGSDTTGESAAGTGGTIKSYPPTEMVKLCLTGLSYSGSEPEVIAAPTYCNPQQSIPGNSANAGTYQFGVHIDKTSADYIELVKALKDAKTRALKIVLPDNGYVVTPVVVSYMGHEFPIGGAQAESGTMVCNSAPARQF